MSTSLLTEGTRQAVRSDWFPAEGYRQTHSFQYSYRQTETRPALTGVCMWGCTRTWGYTGSGVAESKTPQEDELTQGPDPGPKHNSSTKGTRPLRERADSTVMAGKCKTSLEWCAV